MGLKSRRRKLTKTSVRQRHSSSKDKNVFSQYGCNILQPHRGAASVSTKSASLQQPAGLSSD